MCGVSGAIFYQHPEELAQTLYGSSYHLHHRGQDAAGITVERSLGGYQSRKQPGTIERVFLNVNLGSSAWTGYSGIAQVRYSTSGIDFNDPDAVQEAERTAQPMEGSFRGEPFFVAYNGNLTPAYAGELSLELYRAGHGSDIMECASWVDTELIVKAIEASREETFEDALLRDVCPRLRGAFSFVFLHQGALYAIRDTHGFRPLEMGRIGNGYLISSEDNVFAQFPDGIKVRTIEPGECVILQRGSRGIEVRTRRWGTASATHFCGFERVYFTRFDSTHGGVEVGFQQEQMGRTLAKECPAPPHADFVIGVPDSGIPSAYGFALESGLPYEPRALIRLHGVGRTFIEPANALRQRGVEFKLVVRRRFVEGKVIVVVDDSIVRATVAARVCYMLKAAGALEVHGRVSSPPVRHGCWYGIDTARMEYELVARGVDDEEKIRKKINDQICQRYGSPYSLDSLGYLSLEGMEGTWQGRLGLCNACWTGNYPVK